MFYHHIKERRISLDDGIYFKIIFDNEVVGGLFAYWTDSSHKEMCLSTLYIAPRAQGKDLAQKAIKYLEDICVDVERCFLEVPELKLKYRHIYEKFGYKRTEETIVINERLTLLIYRK